MINVDVVIVTKDRPGLLCQQVRQVKGLIPFGRLVVVDSGVVLDKSLYAGLGVEVVHTPGVKLGCARQRGLEACCGDFVFFVDDDLVLGLDCFAKMFAVLVGGPSEVVAVSGKVVYGYGDDVVLSKIFRAGRPKVKAHSGGLVLMKRKAVLDAGGFSCDVHWGEDAELASRLERQGLFWVRCEGVAFHSATFFGMVRRCWRNGEGLAQIRYKTRLWCFTRFFVKAFAMNIYYTFKTKEPRALIYYCVLNLAYLFGYGRMLKSV